MPSRSKTAEPLSSGRRKLPASTPMQPGYASLPGDEEREQQLGGEGDQEPGVGRTGSGPGEQAGEAAEEHGHAHDAEESRLPFDGRDHPPGDDGEPDVPGRQEAELAVEARRDVRAGQKPRRAEDDSQR